MRRFGIGGLLAILTCGVGACVSGNATGPEPETYVKWIAFDVPINENVLLRWPKRKMPLRVHLPPPPSGLFENPAAIQESVRDGVVDWTGIAGPDLPSFVFVESAGDADIPIVWEAKPDGGWYVAHCAYDIQPLARRFGVSRILVTGRWSADRIADQHDVYSVVLHEMGHALGLGGHSPNPSDIMYESISATASEGLSARDKATLLKLYARPIGTRIVGARGKR